MTGATDTSLSLMDQVEERSQLRNYRQTAYSITSLAEDRLPIHARRWSTGYTGIALATRSRQQNTEKDF